MTRRARLSYTVFALLTAALFAADLLCGSSAIAPADVWSALTGGGCDPVTSRIVIDIRLLKALTALIAGSALAVSGLEMQTLFRNPLAGPYVLGISSGASLGVALVVLMGVGASLGLAAAAWAGAAAVLAVIAAVGRRIRDIMVILILGMMFSSGVGSVVQLLQYVSDEDALRTFVVWTMGSLSEVTWRQLAVLAPAVIAGLTIAAALMKPLNLLLFGEEYAMTMGINLRSARTWIFLSTTLLAGSVTAFCGPIGFIGLAMPHVTRLVVADSDHRTLLPAVALTGAASLLLCDIVAKLFLLPINVVTALLGIPVVIWVVLKNKSFAS